MNRANSFARCANAPRELAVTAACAIALATLANVALATPIVYEGFDYPDQTDLNTQSGGSGWGAVSWTGGTAVRRAVTPGATYTTLPVVGNKAFVQGSTAGAIRILPAPQGVGAGEESLWISFIGQRDPAGPADNGRFFSLTTYEGGTAAGNERFSIGENSNNANNLWGMHFTSGASSRQEIAGGPAITDQAFLLARINYHPGVNDDIYLWANYNISLGEPAIETAQATSVGGFNLGFDRIAIRAGAAASPLAAAQGFFDEIRIGTTFADAIAPGEGGGPEGNANFDGDTDVDGNDFLTWQRGLGPNNQMNGDANNDGVVDGLDLAVWRGKFGPAAVVAAGAIPEPGTLALAGLVIALGARGARNEHVDDGSRLRRRSRGQRRCAADRGQSSKREGQL